MSGEIKLRGRIETPSNLKAQMNANAVSTTNYNELGNKPQINGVVLYGNKTTEQLGIELKIESDGHGNVTLSIT